MVGTRILRGQVSNCSGGLGRGFCVGFDGERRGLDARKARPSGSPVLWWIGTRSRCLLASLLKRESLLFGHKKNRFAAGGDRLGMGQGGLRSFRRRTGVQRLE
jgi:hypothetical protein